MQVAIIGTGYVGLPTGVGLAELGHNVVCIDNDESKLAKLKNCELTIYEHGLQELLEKHLNKGNISFTASMKEGLLDANLVVVAVGTPPHKDTNEADLQYVYAAAQELAPYLNSYCVVAIKSTVPVGTGDEVEEIIRKINPQASYDVISLPEFLREGYAVYDFFHPDRIVVGADSIKAYSLISKLYEPLLATSTNTKMLCVSRRSSETIKYASNSFLALKIHFINEMADFCEQTGANINEVASGMGLDHRIGRNFLKPGPGFGGSCFPKDTMALEHMAQKYEVNLSLVKATLNGNQSRIDNMAKRLVTVAKEICDEPIVGILGLAFKNGTDDCRFSPAMQIVEDVLKLDPKIVIRVFDPKAMENAQFILQEYADRIIYVKNANEVSHSADVLAILTEWPEFSQINLNYCASKMRNKIILDYRNMISIRRAHELGFSYSCIGMGTDDLHQQQLSRPL